uniref:DUF3883 domain-containing protein n=1 Tax=Bosea sp. NBC_00436 TaxID=2969620 RepID=A0A9E7ZXC4_9HYPH
MPDYVVLKRLTLKSDLGWFKSIFDGHGLDTKQKAITLNKDVMNALWPSLLIRQDAYEHHKVLQNAAKALGSSGQAIFDAEKAAAKAVGTIPVRVEVHGPGGKPPIVMDRIIALQDKNWRLNGDFVTDPPGDPTRFYPTMQEGDLALIGFNDVGWPADPIVVLLSHIQDAPLWAVLQTRVSKGSRSMVEVDPADLVSLANAHGLAAGHIIRTLGSTSTPMPPGSLPSPAAPLSKPRGRRAATSKATPAQLADRLAAAAAVGQLGEQLVDSYLAGQHTPGQPTHTWISQMYAEHPYDFELLSVTGAVIEVLDAKSTSQAWTGEFYMSAAEVTYAAASPVPYRIYRVSEVGPGGAANLRVSDDIRPLAAAIVNGPLASSHAGIRATGFAISPQIAGITWTAPVALPPFSP